MTAPTFVAEYPTAFDTSTTPKTAMNAVSINNGDVLVGVAVHESYGGGTTLDITENGSASWVVAQGIYSSNYSETRAWTYRATSNESLTVTFTKDNQIFGGNVIRFSGSSGIGNSASNASTSGSPSVSITTTQANSAIVVVVSDYNANTGAQIFTSNGGAGSPSNLTGQPGFDYRYGVAIAYYPDAGAAGSKTVGMSAPTGQLWAIIAVEVKGSASSAASLPPNLLSNFFQPFIGM